MLRAMGQTTNLELILINMDRIMSCTVLNPMWEQLHKSHRTAGIGMEKTKHMNQGPRPSGVPTQENRMKTQKPSLSLFCFSLYTYCMRLHARGGFRERYPCALWMPATGLPCQTETPQVSPPRGLDPAPPEEAESAPGEGWVPAATSLP